MHSKHTRRIDCEPCKLSSFLDVYCSARARTVLGEQLLVIQTTLVQYTDQVACSNRVPQAGEYRSNSDIESFEA